MKQFFQFNLKTLSILLFIIMSTKTVKATKSNFITLKTSKGSIIIKTLPKIAPNHVKRIKELVSSGFYNGIIFHRVIEGFMAQTGDPLGNGTGGSGKNLKAEFTDHKYKYGTVGMARSMNPDSGDSQFFICFDGCGHLTGQYTVWGEVVSGMDVVEKIEQGEPPTNPDKIKSAFLGKKKTK